MWLRGGVEGEGGGASSLPHPGSRLAALLYGSTNQRAGIPCGVAKSLRGRTCGAFRPLAQLRVPVGDLATLQSGNAGIKVVLCICVCMYVSV